MEIAGVIRGIMKELATSPEGMVMEWVECDSMKRIEIIVKVEVALGIKFSLAQIMRLECVDDLIAASEHSSRSRR